MDDLSGTPIQRMSRGAGLFLRFFGIFSLLILALWLFGGAEQQSKGVSIRADLLTFIYPSGAAVTGAFFGLFEPIADRSRLAAMAVGIVAIAPWMVGIALTMDHGYANWEPVHTFMAAFMSVVFGCAIGYGFSK